MPDQNIALGVQVPDSMKSISGMLNFANQAQEFQRGNIHLQKEQQANQERVQLQQFMQNPDNFQTNGRIDLEKVNSAIPKIAPLTGGEVLQHLSTLANAQTQAAASKQALTQDQRAIVAGPIGVLGRAGVTDPAVYAKELEALKSTNPDNQELHRLIDSYGTMLKVTPAGDHLPKAAITASQSLMSPGAQQTNLSPTASLQSTGTELRETISQPAVGGNAPSISMTGRSELLPAGVETPAQDALGRQAIQKRDPKTGALTYIAPQGAQYKPLMNLPVGETAETGRALMILRDQSQAAAAQAPAEHFNNQQILKLAPTAFTGTGSPELSRALNSVGLQNVTGDPAKDTAKLRHFLALQIENNARATGANTDAARQLAANAVLPTDTPGEAIHAITKINDAYVTAKELFNAGLVKAVNHPENAKDIFAVRDFQNAWSRSFDPNVMRLINADRENDKAELESIAKELGPERLKALLPKYRAIKSMSESGR